MLKQEGYDFMGAAFEVYNELGYGLAEEIYQQSLEVELVIRGYTFISQAEIDVYYKQQVLKVKYRPDLVVFGQIAVELKATKEICPDHEAQLFNYMRVSKKRVGYLVNFGQATGLQWKRFMLDDLR
ncbi:MAG: GxxExxY protein [Planctomycetota bacterium]|nr:GxxExxY protein [Planctomycetota bacterium]